MCLLICYMYVLHVAPKPTSCVYAHYGSLCAMERSPFFNDIILTVGGCNFSIWKEDIVVSKWYTFTPLYHTLSFIYGAYTYCTHIVCRLTLSPSHFVIQYYSNKKQEIWPIHPTRNYFIKIVMFMFADGRLNCEYENNPSVTV